MPLKFATEQLGCALSVSSEREVFAEFRSASAVLSTISGTSYSLQFQRQLLTRILRGLGHLSYFRFTGKKPYSCNIFSS